MKWRREGSVQTTVPSLWLEFVSQVTTDLSCHATNFIAPNCNPRDEALAAALNFGRSPFKEQSDKDGIRRYKPVWPVGDELVAVASSSAIKVSLTNRTHLFKTSVTGRLTRRDRRVDAAADFMPRKNNYMHRVSDAWCRGQERLCCVFFFFCVRSLPQACAAARAKAMQRAWTIVCFYYYFFFFPDEWTEAAPKQLIFARNANDWARPKAWNLVQLYAQSQPPAQTSRGKPAGRFASTKFSQCLFVLLLFGSAFSMILSPNCRLKSLMTHLASPSFYSFRI